MPRTNLLGLSAYGWESKIRPNVNKIIKMEMAKNELDCKALAEKIDLSYATVSGRLRGSTFWSVTELAMIIHALDIPADNVLKMFGRKL